jgi:RNA polymerase sigma-70 factor (ECF subfamily)
MTETIGGRVNTEDLLAERFETQRPHLRAVAYRMLGSVDEADDAVQEAWLRLSRADSGDVANLGGWLTTVVARVCLDMLRSRTARREDTLPQVESEPVGVRAAISTPEDEALLADSVGLALLVVLETLSPAERLAFVLHDMFAVPFDEIAPIVGRSTVATRQLASRARRHVQGSEGTRSADVRRKRQVVDAFLAASRNGDFEALLSLLDPDVVVRADATSVRMGSAETVRGAAKVTEFFAGRARAARPAMVDGLPGAVWAQAGRPRVVLDFTVLDGRVVGIELLADPEVLERLEIATIEP